MIRSIFLASLLTLAGCSGDGGAENAADPVALVSLGKAQQGSVAETLTLYGAVEKGADALFTLAAPAEANVVRIAAPAGTQVRRGQLVVGLSASPATRAEIAKARSDLATAEKALARAQRLRTDRLASDADVETARQAAEAAKATAQSLSAQAGSLDLRAPGSGYVQTVDVNPGDLVSSGATVATIARSGDLRARFGVEPALAGRLAAGTTLRVSAQGDPAPFDAPILSVDPTIDPQTRLASVYIRVPSQRALGAGQPLSASVPIRAEGNAVTVPYAALLDDGGQPFVFVVTKGVAHRRDVETGASNGDRIAIRKGVAAGDNVVTEGSTALEDGMKVRTK